MKYKFHIDKCFIYSLFKEINIGTRATDEDLMEVSSNWIYDTYKFIELESEPDKGDLFVDFTAGSKYLILLFNTQHFRITEYEYYEDEIPSVFGIPVNRVTGNDIEVYKVVKMLPDDSMEYNMDYDPNPIVLKEMDEELREFVDGSTKGMYESKALETINQVY